ncbi:IclR family transcriptional regulator [Aneurinibacillus sp. UBA3580]|jgi:DNA-binding IclR family transcriptional regulator|uniref:IclR family transcriptional regulator n=1 Tax=Aneurinibacillus sp. UBA3580 TaxID=1946041 RepID=UPI00257FA46B|nr:IclR family transcriptional regulator [Aneurinibacillus sp. UBA3580]
MRNDMEMNGQGIQSLELGINILKKIGEAEKPLTITEIAKLADISKSKLHRYLTSFWRTGFLERDESLRYSIGDAFIRIGLKAYQRIDIKEQARPSLLRLKETLNETVALSVWGDNGPYFIHLEESNRQIKIGIQVGSTGSMLNTTAGQLFAAYKPGEKTEKLIQKELEEMSADATVFKHTLATIKEKGFSRTMESLVPGVVAIGCPVFNGENNMVAAVTIIGLLGVFDISDDSPSVVLLKQECLHLSRSLGFQGTF